MGLSFDSSAFFCLACLRFLSKNRATPTAMIKTTTTIIAISAKGGFFLAAPVPKGAFSGTDAKGSCLGSGSGTLARAGTLMISSSTVDPVQLDCQTIHDAKLPWGLDDMVLFWTGAAAFVDASGTAAAFLVDIRVELS